MVIKQEKTKMDKNTFTAYTDSELVKSDVVVAKFTHDSKLYVGKRPCGFYAEATNKDKMANAGLKLVYQRFIRTATEVKNGIKKVTADGKVIDLASIDSV